MKQIQLTIPNDPEERIENIMTILQDDFKISNMLWLRGSNNSLFLFRCEPEAVEEIISNLSKIGIGVTYGIIDVLNLSVSLPSKSVIKSHEAELSQRISIEEIQRNLVQSTKSMLNYLIFIVLGALMASAGLLLNNVTFVIASMIIAPFMGPILSFSFGLLVVNKPLVRLGFTQQIYGVLISIGIGLFMGIISNIVGSPIEPTHEMLQRTFPVPLDIIVALCAGIAVGFCATGTLESALVGIAIAASLMPPAANVGIALGYGVNPLALGSFTLLLLNIVLINFSAIFVFKIKKITRSFKPTEYWEEISEEFTAEGETNEAKVDDKEQDEDP